MFENRLHHHRKEKEKSDILEELEFISEESVKDKSCLLYTSVSCQQKYSVSFFFKFHNQTVDQASRSAYQ